MDEAQFAQDEDDLRQQFEELVDQYGPHAVVQELQKQFPKADFLPFLADLGPEPQALQEAPKLPGPVGAAASLVPKKWYTKVWNGIKTLVGGGATLGGGALAFAGGAMRGVVGKKVDQDVRIADVVPGIVLRVTNPELEELMSKTNELLAAMAGQMVQDMEQLDLSMDHVAAGLTGTSVQDVQGQQAVGATERSYQTLTPEEGEEQEEELPPRVKMPAPKSPPRRSAGK